MKKLFTILAFVLPVVAAHSATVTVFSTNQTWRYAPGTAEASTPIAAWRSNAFNDASFVNAAAPFWYDTQAVPDTSTRIGGTHIVGMQNAYFCIFLRKQFVLTNTPYLTNLQLNANVDDGFVAWINGYEVLRVNPPVEPFTTNSSVVTASPEPVAFTTYNLPAPGTYLDASGTNVLTVQVFNAGIGSSDLDFDTELLATSVTPVNVLAPGHPIVGVGATAGSSASSIAASGGVSGNAYPLTESPDKCIDVNTATKYLNFARINCGFIVTIPNNLAKVNGFQFSTANDSPERDPATVTLEGTSAPDPTTAASGSTWVQIYAGPSGLAADPGRLAVGAVISFINSSSFNTFRMLISDTRQPSANSMQFSEIQFQGQFALDAVPPTVGSFLPAAGTVESPLSSVTVRFSEPVSGVAASALLLNGTPAAGVTGSGSNYVFTLPPLPLGLATVSFANNPGIADFAAPPNLFNPTNVTWQYTVVDTTPPVVVTYLPATNTFVRTLTRIEVFFSEPVTGVDPGDLLINNVPATDLVLGVPGQYAFTFTQPATGVVQVAWAGGHGIRDLATIPNNFGGGTWIYTLDPNASFDVRINEFMTDNQNGIRDADGSREDWIELYNGGTTPVSLDGWFLTDEAGNLPKWRFPAGVQMQANSYLLVWASAKNLLNIGALHTNFKLDKDGSYLALVLPDSNTVVSAFAPAYPPQRADASYGRDRLDPNILGFYNTPTPNAANSVGGPSGFSSDVKFSLGSRTFVSPFSLTLSTASTSAVIRYVIITNAAQASASVTNVPTTSSPIYTNPIPISVTTEIRARAFEPGLFPGTPRTESFVQVTSDVQNFNSDRPVCVVHMLGNGSIPTTTTSGILMAFDNDAGRSSLANQPQTASRMGIHIRGSSTLNNAKSNLRFETWDEFNQDQDYPLLGLPSDSDWVLYGINQFDPGQMHNAIYQWLGKSLGIFNMRTRYVEVFRKIDSGPVTTNDYFGLYLLLETPKVGKDRVDVASIHNEDTNSPAITGGYILKIDRVDSEKSFTPPQIGSIRPTPSAIVFTDPPYLASEADPRRLKQISYMQNYILSFITNLDSVSYTNAATGYAQYINPDQWVNHLIANIVPFNVDGYRLSGFIYKDRNARLEQGPMWDCDRCMGTGGTTTPNGDNRCFNPRLWRLPATAPGTDNGTDFFGLSTIGVSWFSRLFSDPDFWQRWIDRYQAVRTNEYSTNAVFAMLDGFHAQIREAQVREQARWGTTSANFTWPRSGLQTVNGYTFDFGPADNFGRGRFSNEVAFQKQWFADRFNFLDTNFLSMPTLSYGSTPVTTGTVVTITPAAKAGSLLLYTLDGTDPRLPGGAVSPVARTNVGALALTVSNNVRVFARSYNTSHANVINAGSSLYGNPLLNSFWSGPVAATYFTAIPPLRITEIMYHPENPPAGNTNDADNFEYVEVKNISGGPLNLNGFRLRGGVDFLFPGTTLAAGQAAVVVKHVTAFQARYGMSPLILGSYSNNLANDGDHLILEGALREPILDFEFKDSWYPVTDGAGFSLQIVDGNLAPTNWGLKTSWRASGTPSGSPGTDDAGAIVFAPILINEILATAVLPLNDAIELFNPTAAPVNIGGWFLTDNYSNPKKYRIPDGTSVPATGYLVLSADTSFSNAFNLSSSGEEIYLFSGDANTNLTGYLHGFDFGAQASGITFGRYVTSDGVQYPAQSAPTLGSVNAGPQVGPLVIAEIMYHPPDIATTEGPRNNTRDEYIELRNITGQPQPLYDPANPANTWRLRDAVGFTFPTNLMVPAGGHVLVVSFDPQADPQAEAGFRSRNGVLPVAPVLGPYQGQLDNPGEAVELVRPDLPQPPGEPDAGAVYYILVDKVNYSNSAPWPAAADGLGFSLQRIVAGAFGNDATNWNADFKTPGYGYNAADRPVITLQPQSISAFGGRSASFSLTATGAPPLFYQWFFGSSGITGATNSVYLIPSVASSNAGTYRCLVQNLSGGTYSSDAVLTYIVPPNITLQPTNLFFSVLPDPRTPTNPASRVAIFRVLATSLNPPVSYQWRMNGTNLIPGADTNIAGINTDTLTISNVVMASAGWFSCAIADARGPVATILSSEAVLGIKPYLWVPPGAQTVANGSPVSVSAIVLAFPPPYVFQWRRSNSPIGVQTNSQPTTTPTNFMSFNAGSAGFTNTTGSFSNSYNLRLYFSNLANLILEPMTNYPAFAPGTNNIFVVADTDGDGIPNYIETALGLATNNPADGLDDKDLDGMSNVDEYRAGTDPNDFNSVLRITQTTVPGQAILNFGAISNRTYTLQYSDGLPANPWLRLADVPHSPTNRTEMIPDPAWTTNRFYRVVTPRAP